MDLQRILAVADGVGSWIMKGIDSGIYARELCAKFFKSI
jgi:hypothetical protein